MSRVTPAVYRALAEFRYQIRCFLNCAERDARTVGLEPQQYLLLLALRGLPEGQESTIRNLAERLQVRHHSAVELIDRLAKRGLARRVRGRQDRRNIMVHITPRGERLLAKLAQRRLEELCSSGPALLRTLNAVIARAKKRVRSHGARRRNKK